MNSINVLRKPENKMLNQLINRSVIANTSVPPCADNKRDWSEAQRGSANKDMRGQGSPGPGITHSQGDMAHYDSPLCWGGGTGKAKWGREYEEGSQHTPNGENGN